MQDHKFSSYNPRPKRQGMHAVNEKVTAGVPLAKLIKRELIDRPDLVMRHHGKSVAAERFRRLKALLSRGDTEGNQVIVVTSPAPGEGKSFVSMNLALTCAADLDSHVVIVDADMRRPGLKRMLQPEPRLGLVEYLRGETELEHVLYEVKDSPLHILSSGETRDDPTMLLSSDRAARMIEELRRRFRWIIVDTPPIVPFTDADIISRTSDGVLLVVRSDQTAVAMYEQAISAVTKAQILGVVFNDATFRLSDRTHYETRYYDRYYGAHAEK